MLAARKSLIQGTAQQVQLRPRTAVHRENMSCFRQDSNLRPTAYCAEAVPSYTCLVLSVLFSLFRGLWPSPFFWLLAGVIRTLFHVHAQCLCTHMCSVHSSHALHVRGESLSADVGRAESLLLFPGQDTLPVDGGAAEEGGEGRGRGRGGEGGGGRGGEGGGREREV